MPEEILEMHGVIGLNPKERIAVVESPKTVIVEIGDGALTRFIALSPDAAIRFADQIVHTAGRVKLRVES